MAEVLQVLAGRAVPFGPQGEPSAIGRTSQPGPLVVTKTGIPGDEHGDADHHGGADEALHQYPFEHYVAWRAERPDLAHSLVPGAFGESNSTPRMNRR